MTSHHVGATPAAGPKGKVMLDLEVLEAPKMTCTLKSLYVLSKTHELKDL